MGRASRGNINRTTPRPQDRYRQMRRRAETKEPDPLSGFHAGYSQASEADNTCTKQRRGVQIVENIRKWEDERNPGHDKIGISSVHCVPGECRRVAKVFESAPAIET